MAAELFSRAGLRELQSHWDELRDRVYLVVSGFAGRSMPHGRARAGDFSLNLTRAAYLQLRRDAAGAPSIAAYVCQRLRLPMGRPWAKGRRHGR